MRRFFRSDETQDRQLQEVAQEMEEYLNTLLAIPRISTCTILQLFLQIPQEMESTQNTATELGEAAAESLAQACSGLCKAVRAFCVALLRRSNLLEEDATQQSDWENVASSSQSGLSMQGIPVDS